MKTKFIPLIFLSFIILFGALFFCRQKEVNSKEYEYLRIHINANSCEDIDQNIKYDIRDKIINFLSNSINGCKNKEEAMEVVKNNLSSINAIANSVIADNGLKYDAKSELKNEYFPSRCYENCVLDAGNYDALVITLGDGVGDNWWCVVYPPLCFVNKNSKDEQNIVYQSKIAGIFKKYFR